MQRKRQARKKRIQNKQKAHERTSHALQAMKAQQARQALECDNESTVASPSTKCSSSASKLTPVASRSKSTPKSTESAVSYTSSKSTAQTTSTKSTKSRSSKSKLPDSPQTPDCNKVTHYFSNCHQAHQSSNYSKEIPSTISTTTSQTSASDFWSPTPPTQTTESDFSSPPATEAHRVYNFSFAPNDLPAQLKANYKYENKSVATATPVSYNQLPFTVYHNCGDIKVGRERYYGCEEHFSECLERKYCDLCLHAVKNRIDDVGFECITDFSIHKVYHNKYMAHLHCNLKDKYGKYEVNHLLNLPKCMMQGSLENALELVTGSEKGLQINEWLMHQRVCDIMYRIQEKERERAYFESADKLTNEEK